MYKKTLLYISITFMLTACGGGGGGGGSQSSGTSVSALNDNSNVALNMPNLGNNSAAPLNVIVK